MAKNPFSGVKNSEIFKIAQKFSPNFQSQTAKVTAERLNDGWEANKNLPENMINDWFSVTMQMILQKVDVATAKNPLEDIVEEYANEYGGVVQRLAVNAMKPLSPKFRGLTDGASVDMQVVRKPKITQRFWVQNDDFYNSVTLQEYQIKLIFAGEFGMAEFTGGILAQLENSYTIHKFDLAQMALDKAINPEETPLQTSQIYGLTSYTDAAPTEAELTEFVQIAQNLGMAMETAPASSAYNAGKFLSVVNPEDMVMLIRPELLTNIKTKLMVGAYNPENLALPFAVKPVQNFGGLIPYKEEGLTTRLYPAYDAKTGEQIGWAESAGQTSASVQNGAEFWEDPNSDVLAVIIQKGTIFHTAQNGIRMGAAPYNEAGRYQTYHFTAPGAGIHTDYNYNVIVICKSSAAALSRTAKAAKK